MSFIKTTVLCCAAIALVNCSSDKKDAAPTKPPVADTPTVIVDSQGHPVQTINPPVASADEQMQDAWTSIGFTPALMKAELLNGAICSISEKQFVGCFFAARKLSEIVNGKDTILHLSGATPNAYVGEPVKQMRLFTVYKKPEATAMQADDLRLASEFEKETARKLIELYNQILKGTEQQNRVNVGIDAVNQGVDKLWQDMMKEYELHPNITEEDDAKIMTKYGELMSNPPEWVSLKNYAVELNKGLLSDISELIDQGFAKTPERARSQKASEIYNTFRRNSADAHSRLALSPELEDSIMKNKIGVGVYIMDQGNAVYMSPIDGGAAQKAGVRKNDKLVKVDGHSIANTDEASLYLRGKQGTKVVLTVERLGTSGTVDVTIIRQPIKVASYSFENKKIGDKVYGFLKIRSFEDNAMPGAVRKYVTANDSQVRGWILDLRGNPGGLVSAAVGLCDVFVVKGQKVVYSSQTDDVNVMNPDSGNATSLGPATAKEPVVLIDGGSASASELVSGALQELGEGFIIGETSFGKGSMQAPDGSHPEIKNYKIWAQMFPQTMFGGANAYYFKTIGRYFLPNGRTPEWVGVQPDIEVLDGPNAAAVFKIREKDEYPFSMPPVGEVWQQKRVELVNKIKTCVTTTGSSVPSWPQDASTPVAGPFGSDGDGAYQAAYAVDAAECLAQ